MDLFSPSNLYNWALYWCYAAWNIINKLYSKKENKIPELSLSNQYNYFIIYNLILKCNPSFTDTIYYSGDRKS